LASSNYKLLIPISQQDSIWIRFPK